MISFVCLLLPACNAVSTPFSAYPGSNFTRTGLLLSDIHFDPLNDPTLGNRLAQAPATQRDSILTGSTVVTRYDTTRGEDTNFLLLQSALAAMRSGERPIPTSFSSPATFWCTAFRLVHGFPALFDSAVTNHSPAAFAAFVNKTEAYLVSAVRVRP